MCPHCDNKNTQGKKSNFCYSLYKSNPSKFISHTYAKLKKFTIWPTSSFGEYDIFTEIFCKSEICKGKRHNRCGNIDICLVQFICQSDTKPIMSTYDKVPKGRTIKKEPYITVLCGGSDAWVAKVNG
jgi:hypothetical protein